jgi:pimeloyl-ACP methyl ester carboxylesterase
MPAHDAPSQRVPVIVALAVAFLLLTGVAYLAYRSAAGITPSGVQVVAEEACPFSEFTCVTLRVPRDHFGGSGETVDVTFAVLRASGEERQGVFVTATGGPGSSGIASADGYTSVFDPAITERFDVVFFDQRGIGLSGPIQCVDAALTWYGVDDVPTVSDEDAEAYAEAAADFAAACISETGVDPETLDAYATRQAVEDLDAFRRWLGADQLHLYGESYGTQFVQTYAAAHPDAVAALLVDGPVDLTLTGYDYYVEQAQAFEDVLLHTFESCTDACAEEPVDGGLLGAWDALAAELEGEPISYQFTRSDGTHETRELTLADLEVASSAYVYETFDQMMLQRAVAYAARGELAPMARLAYLSLGQDPDTFEALTDPTWSDALYYAVECMDYSFGSGSSEDREDAFLAEGDEADVDDIRLGSIFYGDLPCASWPAGGADDQRPAYLTTDAYPLFVLASTTDPATPYAGAQRIFEQAGDGYLVTQPGGPHVIFGRGTPCPDEMITAFLVDGVLPSERETECEPMAPDPFIPLPPPSVAADDDPVAVLLAIDDEIYYQPEFWAWDGVKKLQVGCLLGGFVTFAANDVGYDLGLEACELVDGLPLTGEGVIDEVEGTTTMTVTSPGDTDLVYKRDAEYLVTVSGTWFGDAVDIEE